MSELIAFLKLIPVFYELFLKIKKNLDEGETQLKVKDSVKTIGEAFDEKDSAKIKALFNAD
jgi:hypothetical protein